MEDDVRQSSADRYALSQAYRWKAERDKAMQELRQLKDRSRDTTVSAYDLLPEEEREALAWVREHGGIAYVKDAWNIRSNLDRQLKKAQTKVERQQSHIELVQGKYKARAHRILELHKTIDDMRPRLMPEGCEWPTVDGEPVVIGERMRSCGIEDCKVVGIDPANARLFLAFDDIEKEKTVYFPDFAKYCHRPEPKVLAADGKPLEAGQTVWDENDDELVIGAIEDGGHTVSCRYADVGDGIPTHGLWSPSDLTHQRPVLDADGKPLRDGDEVWRVKDGCGPYHVQEIRDGVSVCVGETCCEFMPKELTHERPALDAGGAPIKVGDTVFRTSDGREFEVTGVDGAFEIRVKDESMDVGIWTTPCGFTHAKPEFPDSWERIEREIERGKTYSDVCVLSIVRRCKELARKESNNE